MTIKIEKHYIPFDELYEFETKEECVAYERNIKDNLKKISFYTGRKKSKLTLDNFDELYSTSTRVVFKDKESLDWCREYFGFCSKYDHFSCENIVCLKFRTTENESYWIEDDEAVVNWLKLNNLYNEG